MKKMNPKAKWSGLSPAQLSTLEHWLFEEHLTYDEALIKAKTELGFAGSRTSLQRFYRNQSRKRLVTGMKESVAHVREVKSAAGKDGALLDSGLKLLTQKFMELVLENNQSEMVAVARLLLHHEANEARQQENEIQLETLELKKLRLGFDQEAWKYNVLEQCMKILPELNELVEKQKQESDPLYERKRMLAIHNRLFGQNDYLIRPLGGAGEAGPPKTNSEPAPATAAPETPPTPPAPVTAETEKTEVPGNSIAAPQISPDNT